MKNFKRILSVVLVVMMVATMFVPSFATETEVTATPYVSSNGATMTIHELYNVKDLWIAEGEYNTYREVKDAGYLFSVTSAKLGDATEYSYVVTNGGMHTVVIRYNDGTQIALHHNIEVTDPVFTTNGLQVTVSNLQDVKVIRTAYGEHDSVKSIKATEGFRNFSNKTEIKDRDPYTIQYREEGVVTIVVEYTHGYKVFYTYNVQKNEPTVAKGDDFVKFGNIDNLVMVRYAEGEYASSTEIKATGKSKVLKSNAIVDGYITVADLQPGTYTFSVQYNDESYNIYVITIAEKTWTITFDAGEGTMDAGFKTSYGINTGDYYADVFGGAYPTASLEGYDFTGWYLEKYNFTLTAGDVESGYYAVSEDCTLVALWEDAAGTASNPETVELTTNMFGGTGAYVTADIKAGYTLFHYYTTTVEKAGALSVKIAGATDADYNNIGWKYSVAVNGEAGELHYSDAAEPVYYEVVDVVAGDVVTVYVCTYDPANPDVTPEGSVSVQYAFDVIGSMNNPEAVTLTTNMFGATGASLSTDLAAGNSGYYYTITAPKAGNLTVNQITAVDADYNNLGWQFVVNNTTAGTYGETHWSDSDPLVTYETIAVSEGDVITVFLSTYDPANMWANPAGTVSAQVIFEAVGSSNNPEAVALTTNMFGATGVSLSKDFAAGDSAHYYSITAPADGKLSISQINAIDAEYNNIGWQYAMNNTTASVYGDTHWSDDETVVTSESIDVTAGDVVVVMLATYDPADMWNNPAGTVSAQIIFDAVGSSNNPEAVALTTNMFGATGVSLSKDFAAGASAHYYSITAPADGKLSISQVNAIDAEYNNIGWQYAMNNTTAGVYGDTHWSDDEVVVTSESIDVTAGDVVVVMLATYDPADMWNNPAGTVSAQIIFDAVGSANNPEAVTLATNMFGAVGASLSKDFAAGDAAYYYSITAPADGQIAVSQVGAVDADYNNIGWQFVVNNTTAGKYGDTHWSDDETVVTNETVTVSAGDVVVVMLATYDPADMWNSPAGTVSAQITFNEMGSANYPAGIAADGLYTTAIEAGSQGYYYCWTATTAGTLTVAIDTANCANGWTYVVNNQTAGTYGDTHWCDDETVVAYETITVSAGDIVIIMVNTYNPEDMWNAPAGNVVWSLNYTGETAYTITLDAGEGTLLAPTTYGCNQNDSYFDIFGGYYPVPTLEGYTFAGWYNEKYGFTLTAGDVANGGTYVVAESNDFVALWEEAVA